MKRSLILFTALAVVGCSSSNSTTYQPKKEDPIPAAVVTPGQESVLFPVAVGNKWRYKASKVAVNGGQKTGAGDDFFWHIAKVEDLPNGQGQRIHIETIKKDVVTEKQTWLLQKGGLFLESGGAGTELLAHTPPEPILVFPIELDKMRTYEGTVPSPYKDANGKTLMGKQVITSVMTAPEEVDTNMGRISAFKVESKGTISAGPGKTTQVHITMFWAPNVGLVRMRQAVAAENQPLGASILMLLSSKSLVK